MFRVVLLACTATLSLVGSSCADQSNARAPRNESDLKYWLTNMVAYHRFSIAEVQAATGLSKEEIVAATRRFGIARGERPTRYDDSLLVLPYPGGRHPRIGFLDGAIDPQRETKISVFTPWDPASYVVVDVPEAIWSNLGLIYLAHTHVPTVWSKSGIKLEKLEWKRGKKGRLEIQRQLPNEISFGASIRPQADHVAMRMWLTNASLEKLTDLRVQNCVMLKMAEGFAAQTGDNKLLAKPYVACRNAEGNRWVITAWEPCHRPWQNPPCPCMHSDPRFEDCEPGKTKYLRGWLSFYEGEDIRGELERIDALKWQDRKW